MPSSVLNNLSTSGRPVVLRRSRFALLARAVVPLLLLSLTATGPATALEGSHTFKAKDFVYKELHEDGDDAKAALRCYKMVEDEDDPAKKALSVSLSKTLIRKAVFEVLRTPSLGELEEGTYRATVRLKVHGMLNSLGCAVGIQVGGQTREVWMNEVQEEDAYQEFSVDFESRPGDIVTRRDGFSWGAPGGPGSLVEREKLPGIKTALERNYAPWLEKFCHGAAERVVCPRLRRAPGDVPKYAAVVKGLVEAYPGRELPSSDPVVSNALPEEIVAAVNAYGENASEGVVSLFFPKNTTGQGVGGTRGPATPQPTLRRLFVEWIKVEKLPEPDHAVLREVRARYPWCRPGERQVFTVWMHNRSGSARTNTVRLVLLSGLEHREVLWEREVRLADRGYENLVWEWQIPKEQRLWGQTVVAEILRDGVVVSSERAWFTIHRFSNATMIHDRPNTRRFRHPYAVGPPNTQNHKELVGANCTIYDAAGVVPDPEVFFDPYVVGNGSYFISIPTLASMTMRLANAGIAPFFYLESNGSAKRAFEIFWDHPDWVPEMPANMDNFFLQRDADTETWLKWHRGELKTSDGKPPPISRAGGAYSGQLVGMNGIVKENVDRVIDGSLKLAEHTSFAGVRWDGLPFRAKNSKSLGGTWGKTQDELDAISVANLRRYRDTLRATFPNFELRANGGLVELEERQEDPYDFDKAFEILSRDPLHIELVSAHGSIMEEIWMSYAGFGNYANSCLNYLRASHFENSAFKRAGGHNGHMLWFYDGKIQYTPDEIYQQLFTFLGGAHLDGAFGPIVESIHELGVYAARFSEYFWDPELRAIRDMADKVELDAEADIWFAESGFEKTNERGNTIYVIPIINPPVTELWLQNRFGLLPEPIREPIGLTVQVPEGCSGTRAVYLLDNDPYPEVKTLEFEDNESDVYFEIPELVVFKVVLVEFEK